MSNICSVHPPFDCNPDCPACNTTIEEFLPEFEEKLKEAKATGLHACKCGFFSYNTITICPLCNKPKQLMHGISVEAIVAIDLDNGYAKDGQIPWHYPEDFKWFQQQTKGCAGVMGSLSYKYINAKLGEKAKVSVLPNRNIFVLSRTMEPVSNATVIREFEDFFFHSAPLKPPKRMIMGGAEIYKLGLPYCDVVHITRINNRYSCDSFFPFDYVEQNFTLEATQSYPEFEIQTWKRAK